MRWRPRPCSTRPGSTTSPSARACRSPSTRPYYLAEHAAYQTGVVGGCVRARSFRTYLPVFERRRGAGYQGERTGRCARISGSIGRMIRGERIYLTEFDRANAETIRAWLNDPEVYKYLMVGHTPITKEDERRYYEAHATSSDARRASRSTWPRTDATSATSGSRRSTRCTGAPSWASPSAASRTGARATGSTPSSPAPLRLRHPRPALRSRSGPRRPLPRSRPLPPRRLRRGGQGTGDRVPAGPLRRLRGARHDRPGVPRAVRGGRVAKRSSAVPLARRPCQD